MTTHCVVTKAKAARVGGLLAAITAALLAGACSADLGKMDGLAQLTGSAEPEKTAAVSKSEIDKAVEYWGKEHKKQPNDLKTALSYARNLKAAGKREDAFAVLQQLALVHGNNMELASEYGRLALDLGQAQVAQSVLAMADDPANPDWRVISARGTALAKQGNYTDAIPFYERALGLAPKQPSILNNLAMAHAANGEPAKAEEILRTIAADSNDPKVRQNLALVLGLQSKHDEAAIVAAESQSPATASANADYMRRMVKVAPSQEPQDTSAAAPAAAKPQAVASANAARKKAPKQPDMRGSGTASEVASTAGSWSTSVARAP